MLSTKKELENLILPDYNNCDNADITNRTLKSYTNAMEECELRTGTEYTSNRHSRKHQTLHVAIDYRASWSRSSWLRELITRRPVRA